MSELRTIDAARRALDEGAAPVDLMERASDLRRRWNEDGPPLHAFLSTASAGDAEGAAGRRPDRGETAAGPVSVLEGVPVAVKDNLCTVDLPTTCASRVLDGYRSPYAATAVRRLEGAGARVFGKTNLDEFGMGSSTENSAFGPTRNPVDRERVPGGSSGGSAAAVAAGIVPAALGSSTGGSVRQPAAMCGVVGVKPTYGRVSRYGLVAFASSLDQVGVLARGVEDAARVLETISGDDPRDATCRDRPVPRAAAVPEVDLDGAVLGVPDEYLGEGLDPGVRQCLAVAAAAAEEGGARVRRISLPATPRGIPCYYVLATAEASSNLARYDGVRYGARADGAADAESMQAATRGQGFGDEVKRRVMLGTYALSAGYYEDHYLRAQQVRREIARDFAEVFDDGVDAVLAPTAPTPAFPLGERTDDPYRMYLNDVYTVSANLAGLPAVSLPAGNADGLPVGAQLMCPPWEEERMLGLALGLEEALGYRHPLDG
jgi:aspartyl-tRNA(Asn)/glutamyl-tRNA(Gln) amidotransferase subunit A